jgi:hypothetical protein
LDYLESVGESTSAETSGVTLSSLTSGFVASVVPLRAANVVALTDEHIDVNMLLCENVFMRTTVDLPDETFRQLKIEAALCGTKLKDLITEFIEKGLAVRAAGQPLTARSRSPLPQIRPKTGVRHPALTNAELEDLLTNADHHARL